MAEPYEYREDQPLRKMNSIIRNLHQMIFRKKVAMYICFDFLIFFLLWGGFARSKRSMLTNPNHLVLEAPHPSPLSAYRGFFGCRHFSRANQFLEEHGTAPVDWTIE